MIRDCYKEPVRDAVVKLIEVDHKGEKEERKPVSHTFTDKNGEFVFGPLCPGKEYAIQIWVDDVKHVKICAKAFHEGKCLKGIKLDKCDYDLKHYERPNYYEEYKDYEKHYDEDYKDKEHDKQHHDEYNCKDYDEYTHKDCDKQDDKKDEKNDNDKDDKKDECKCNKYYNYK